MISISDYFAPGEKISVAWVEHGSLHEATFTVTAVGSNSARYDLEAINEDRLVHLLQDSTGMCALVDPNIDADDAQDMFLVLGVTGCPHAVAWDATIFLQSVGFTPAEAIDTVAIGLDLVSLHGYAQLRNMQPADLEDRVRAIINEIENPPEAEEVA